MADQNLTGESAQFKEISVISAFTFLTRPETVALPFIRRPIVFLIRPEGFPEQTIPYIHLFFDIQSQPRTCTLHLSRSQGDRWGTTDIGTLSLHLTLFSASLRAFQNFSPVHSEMLFSQRFFCWPLLLPPCTVPYKTVLASPDDLDKCPNHFNLLFFTVVKISS